MKWMMTLSILFSTLGLQAEDNTKSVSVKVAPSPEPKMTTKDAKMTCKDLGKTGPELIQCMKDKKENK